MKQNKYDEREFFEKYVAIPRSRDGLDCAREWGELRGMLPKLEGKRVLDLGCGLGWHCKYAAEQDAEFVVGIDISKKMLERAQKINGHPKIKYMRSAIEDYAFKGKFDVVISSLAFHYLDTPFDEICKRVASILPKGGHFIFSVEHPSFTTNDGYYFDESERDTNFYGEDVEKYHRTMTTYFRGLLQNGFLVQDFCEPQSSVKKEDDLQREPLMCIFSAVRI